MFVLLGPDWTQSFLLEWGCRQARRPPRGVTKGRGGRAAPPQCQRVEASGNLSCPDSFVLSPLAILSVRSSPQPHLSASPDSAPTRPGSALPGCSGQRTGGWGSWDLPAVRARGCPSPSPGRLRRTEEKRRLRSLREGGRLQEVGETWAQTARRGSGQQGGSQRWAREVRGVCGEEGASNGSRMGSLRKGPVHREVQTRGPVHREVQTAGRTMGSVGGRALGGNPPRLSTTGCPCEAPALPILHGRPTAPPSQLGWAGSS